MCVHVLCGQVLGVKRARLVRPVLYAIEMDYGTGVLCMAGGYTVVATSVDTAVGTYTIPQGAKEEGPVVEGGMVCMGGQRYDLEDSVACLLATDIPVWLLALLEMGELEEPAPAAACITRPCFASCLFLVRNCSSDSEAYIEPHRTRSYPLSGGSGSTSSLAYKLHEE